MAAKVEIDIPGIGLIEAKNAASEETLLEILKVMQATQKAVQTQNKKGSPAAAAGGGAGAAMGGAAGAAAGMGASLAMAGKAAMGLGKAVGVAGTMVGKGLGVAGAAAGFAAGQLVGAASAAGKAIGALAGLGTTAMNLAGQLAGMGNSISSAAGVVNGALSSLPGVFGKIGAVVGTAFMAVTAAAERLVGAYQTAAQVGATFGGSLNSMTAAASGAGMTLEKFAGLIQKNGEALTYLGGTTEAGAKRFAQLSKELRTGQAGAELLRLGYSTEQVNSGMAAYIGLMGKSGALQNMTASQIAKSSASYLKDLDALAKITGQTREEKQKEQEALMKDAQFRAAVAGMDAESQKQMMNYVTSFPKEQQAAIKDMIATGTVTSEEAVKFAAMMPQAANQAMAFGRTLQAGGKISQDQMNRSRDAAIGEAKMNVQRYKAQGQFNTEMGQAYVGMAELASKTAGDWAQAQKEGTEATKKANQAEQIEKFKQRIAEISNTFTALLASSGMLDTFGQVLESVVSIISAFVIPAVQTFMGVLQAIVPPIMNVLVPVITSLSAALMTMLGPVLDSLGKMFGRLSESAGGLSNFIQGLVDTVFPIFSAAVRGAIMVFEGIFNAVMSLVDPIMNLIGSFTSLGTGTETFQRIILTAADMVSGYFSILGEVLGGIINVAASVVKWFGDVVLKTEFMTKMLGYAGDAFQFLSTYLSPAGVKAMMSGLNKIIGDVGDFVGSFIDGFKLLLAGILQVVGKIPGLGKFADMGKSMEKEVENDAKAREEAAKQRDKDFKDAKQVAKDDKASRDKKINEQLAGVKQDQKEYQERKAHMSKMGSLNKEEEDAKKKAAESKEVDMSSPLAMLESFSQQQNGFFANRIDQAREEQSVRIETDAAKKQMAEAEQKFLEAKTDEEKKAAIEAIKAAQTRLENIKKEKTEASRPGAAPSPSAAPTKLPAGSQIQGLGAVAAHFEAGGKAGTVSTGHGDFGGKSYGAFQLSSKTGDVEKFLEKSGYAKQFAGMEVGSKEFDAKWKELGSTKEFAQAQATHAKSTHYDPQMQKLSKAGLDMSGRGAGVQEAIMSTANQYGANTDLIMKALKDKDTSKMSDKDIINAIQDYKADTVKTRFKSSSAAVQAGVAKRIEQERSMLLGVEGGPPAKAEGGKPATAQPATATKTEETKPSEVKPKTSAQKVMDWAYSIFIGKAAMSQVPKPYLDEVGKLLSNPPANWSAAPKTPEAKVETAKVEQGSPPEQKPTSEVKPNLDDASVRNWAYAVFEGKISLGQVPQMYRDKVANLLKDPPKEWSKAPGVAKPAEPTAKQETSGMKDLAAKDTSNQEFKINGKKVSKEEFDSFTKANPQIAEMMDMAKNLSNGQGMPGKDMMQQMGSMLPIGTEMPGLPENILGPNINPAELFKSQLADLGAGNTDYKINGKPVSKEEFEKVVGDNPAFKNMMGQLEGGLTPPNIDPSEFVKTSLTDLGAGNADYKINGKPVSKEEFSKFMDSNPQLANLMGGGSLPNLTAPSMPSLTGPDSTKDNMADAAATAKVEEANAMKLMFETLSAKESDKTPITPNQEPSADPMNLLNTKLEQLVNINQSIATVNSDQLRVQKSLSFSGDVYNTPF